VDASLVSERISALVTFLDRSQRPDGTFPTLRRFIGPTPGYVTPSEFPDWHNFGTCVFATASIAYHLAEIDLPGLPEIRLKACESLVSTFENGVIRYVPGNAKPIDFPPDIDDTCLVAAALRANGLSPAVNRSMLLANTDGRGTPYTWLVPRWRHLGSPANFVWLWRDRREWMNRMIGYGKTPEQMKPMLREYAEAAESGIAANVLLYLGVSSATRPILATLIRRISDRSFLLQYYADPVSTYFNVARLFRSGVSEVAQLRAPVLEYLSNIQTAEGEISGPFPTALGALAFMYFEAWDSPHLESAIRYLANHEMQESGWQPTSACNDLEHRIFDDGGAELTAAMFLEALYRYRRRFQI
jgi:hypothetical protein